MIGTSVIYRLELKKDVVVLPEILRIISDERATLSGIDIARVRQDVIVRDLTVFVKNDKQAKTLEERFKKIEGVRVINVSDSVFLAHLGGKIEIRNRMPLKTRQDLSIAYTPGVAKISMALFHNPESAFNLTIKGNCIAIVSDGTAVLGLGDIGPYGALPVMEGKAMLLKNFADVNAFPICLSTKEVDEIVNIVEKIAPVFGGINLEDISAPRCFEIEEKLQKKLDIPVFHDDQHGTAVVALAGLMNALKVVKKDLSGVKIVILGIGAAGFSVTKLLLKAGAKNIIGLDSKGIIYEGRTEGMNIYKDWFAKNTNKQKVKGGIKEALIGADVFIGLSKPGLVTREMAVTMNKNAIIFAMSNPDPEILPEDVPENVVVFATGRSDYPNQINNVLCFPGLFKGLLEVRSKGVNTKMLVDAAKAIAKTVPQNELALDYIIPSVFDKKVVRSVANAVAKEAIKSGLARRKIKLED